MWFSGAGAVMLCVLSGVNPDPVCNLMKLPYEPNRQYHSTEDKQQLKEDDLVLVACSPVFRTGQAHSVAGRCTPLYVVAVYLGLRYLFQVLPWHSRMV